MSSARSAWQCQVWTRARHALAALTLAAKAQSRSCCVAACSTARMAVPTACRSNQNSHMAVMVLLLLQAAPLVQHLRQGSQPCLPHQVVGPRVRV